MAHYFLNENVDADPEQESPDCGYIIKMPVQLDEDEEYREKVVIFNLHGEQYKHHKKNFYVSKFVPFRVGLREHAIRKLSLATATVPIPDYDPYFPTVDPYTIIEVFDFGYHAIPKSFLQIQRSTLALRGKEYVQDVF
ncbi:Non-classical phosphatidylinositol transfer protein (PITP) [Rhizina undulata]